MDNYLLYIFLLCFLLPARGPAQADEADWITHPEVHGPEQAVVLFRTQFDLATVPDSFRIDVSADNHFRLFVNGEWVAWGPQLGEITHWRYDRIDLKPWLREGRNTLAVQVINWGHYRMFGLQSVHTALWIQGFGPSEVLTTGRAEQYRTYIDRSITEHAVQWRVAEPDIIGGLYANNPTDSLLARKHPWGWEQPDFDDREWALAPFLEWGHRVNRGGGFLWLLTPRSTPPQRRTEQQFARLRQSTAPPGPKGWWLGRQSIKLPPKGEYRFLLDMDAVTFGFPELRWSGGEGATMQYTWAENLFNHDRSKAHRDSVAGKLVSGYFDVITADGGSDRRYVPTWYRAFRYLEIQVTTKEEPLELFAPVLQRVTSSVPITAEWKSDDPVFDDVIAAGRRTVEICTQDYFLSDAYYETMQYVGDTKVHALVWQALTGDLRHTRNALLDFNRSRNPEGLLKSCYPLRYNFYHSTYSLIFVDMVYDYLEASGDTAFVAQFLPGIRLTLDYFGNRYNPESGFLEGVPYKPFIDWYIGGQNGIAPGSSADRSVPVVLHYAHALRSGARLAQAVDYSNDWGERAQQVIERVRERCYLPERKLLAERPSRDFFDQHSNILGVLLDVIPEADQAAALEHTVRDTSLATATYYYRYYLLRALQEENRPDLFREALQPWYDMVGEGATTQVERFESPSKPTRSEAHPWGASPVLFAYTYLVGIDLTDREGPVTMRPAFGHLRWMKGFCPLPGGNAGVAFDLGLTEEGNLQGSITAGDRAVELHWKGEAISIPAGTTHNVGGN